MTERSIATCHCGAVKISFEMEGGLDGLRRCDCSLCRRKYPGAVSGRKDDVVIEQGADNLGTYQFGTMTAKHHFCKTCGIHVYHNRRSNLLEIGVNVACVEGLSPRIAGDARWVDGVTHPNDAPDADS